MPLIIFVAPGLALGGAERHLVRYANGLVARNFRVAIVTIGSQSAISHELSAQISVTSLNSRFLDLRCWWHLGRLLRHQRPDVVFGWSTIANFLACLAAPSATRIVVSELNYPPLSYRIHGRATYAVWRFLTLLYKRADVVTANSDGALDVLRKWVGQGPTFERIFNPIELGKISQLAQEPLDRPDFKNKKTVILALGRLDNEHKGFDLFINALAKLKPRVDWSGVIVGGGPDEYNIRAQIESVGLQERIVCCGPQSNPFPYLACADIFVLPSRREGFPNALLEAMALGKAAIAADCMTGPREMMDDGRCGILVPVNDAKALAAAIDRLIDSPGERQRLGQAAELRVRDAYCEQVVFDRLVEVIKGDLLEKSETSAMRPSDNET